MQPLFLVSAIFLFFIKSKQTDVLQQQHSRHLVITSFTHTHTHNTHNRFFVNFCIVNQSICFYSGSLVVVHSVYSLFFLFCQLYIDYSISVFIGEKGVRRYRFTPPNKIQIFHHHHHHQVTYNTEFRSTGNWKVTYIRSRSC